MALNNKRTCILEFQQFIRLGVGLIQQLNRCYPEDPPPPLSISLFCAYIVSFTLRLAVIHNQKVAATNLHAICFLFYSQDGGGAVKEREEREMLPDRLYDIS